MIAGNHRRNSGRYTVTHKIGSNANIMKVLEYELASPTRRPALASTRRVQKVAVEIPNSWGVTSAKQHNAAMEASLNVTRVAPKVLTSTGVHNMTCPMT